MSDLLTGQCRWCGVEVTWDSFARCWRDADRRYRCRGGDVWHVPRREGEPQPAVR